jgi:hypothetical protein
VLQDSPTNEKAPVARGFLDYLFDFFFLLLRTVAFAAAALFGFALDRA